MSKKRLAPVPQRAAPPPSSAVPRRAAPPPSSAVPRRAAHHAAPPRGPAAGGVVPYAPRRETISPGRRRERSAHLRDLRCPVRRPARELPDLRGRAAVRRLGGPALDLPERAARLRAPAEGRRGG